MTGTLGKSTKKRFERPDCVQNVDENRQILSVSCARKFVEPLEVLDFGRGSCEDSLHMNLI